MNTQEIIDKLTEHGRLIVRDLLAGIYSTAYVNAMLSNRRRRSELFKKTVRMYWEHRRELQQKFNKAYLNNLKEVEL